MKSPKIAGVRTQELIYYKNMCHAGDKQSGKEKNAWKASWSKLKPR